MKSIEQLQAEYFESLNKLNLDVHEEDYMKFEKHRLYLEEFATHKSSRITVYDISKHNYLFYKNNLNNILDNEFKKSDGADALFMISRIHPEDLKLIFHASIQANEYYLTQKVERKKDFQLHVEFRILNNKDEYIRVIEQYSALEMDRKGDTWLVLGMMDLLPSQSEHDGALFQYVDTRNNEIVHFEIQELETPLDKLSKREKEILGLVKEGRLSKEISDRLFISVHTVNTHRQNILKKLNVNNSLGAIDEMIRLY